MPISGINLAYGNSGTIGVEDADILISLKDADRQRLLTNAMLREQCCRGLSPAPTFALLPPTSSPRSSISACRRRSICRSPATTCKANRAYADKLLGRIARVPGIADARIQQAFNEPTLRVDDWTAPRGHSSA